MDSQAQLKRTHAHHHQTEEPIRIHHPEEEEHHEKGASKVLKKVKDKAKKIKKALTKHGHGHEHDRMEHIPDDHDLDEEDDEDEYDDQQIRGGAPVRGKAHIPVNEDVVPPGKKIFPVVPSSHVKPTEPIRGMEPVRGSHTSHVGHEALPHPVRPSGVSEHKDRRGASTLTPYKTPVSLFSATEDVTRTGLHGDEKRRLNLDKPFGLEEDTAAPGTESGSLSEMSNYQSKVTDPTGTAAGEIGAASTVAAPGRRKEIGEDDQLGLRSDLREKRHDFDVKSRPDFGKGFPTGTQGDETQQPSQSSYTDKISSTTSVIADKAAAAKNAVVSKLGYSGEGGDGHEGRVEREETPSSAGGYGSKVTGMVTPVYEKVKETGANVTTKLPFPGGGSGTEAETQKVQDKGVSGKGFLTEKLSPREEDKVLSEVVAEKLHLGGGDENTTTQAKKGTVTQSKEVEQKLGGFKDKGSKAERKHGEKFAEEGEGEGMVEKIRGAVTSWIAGTTDEATQKSTESGQDSSQSIGSTVGKNIGFSGSGGDEAGQRRGNSGSVPIQRKFQDSGN